MLPLSSRILFFQAVSTDIYVEELRTKVVLHIATIQKVTSIENAVCAAGFADELEHARIVEYTTLPSRHRRESLLYRARDTPPKCCYGRYIRSTQHIAGEGVL